MNYTPAVLGFGMTVYYGTVWFYFQKTEQTDYDKGFDINIFGLTVGGMIGTAICLIADDETKDLYKRAQLVFVLGIPFAFFMGMGTNTFRKQ